VYTGNSLSTLQEVACRSRYGYDSSFLTFHVTAGTTYYFLLGTNDNAWIPFHLEVAPPPYPNFNYYLSDPSVFDTIYFYNYSWDPANVGISSIAWNFGDGTTATEPWDTSHRYAKDGDYTVQLTVSTPDGRTASTSRTVLVKTHDVAITKFTVPQSASAGQTRALVVGLNSKAYAEKVRVEFFKSVPGGYASLGYQDQSVPVRSANRTTNFQWSYTFTKSDAAIGKVTFRAVATILEARDALPADNESIAPPTKVSK
jgi:PKD repeat protein